MQMHHLVCALFPGSRVQNCHHLPFFTTALTDQRSSVFAGGGIYAHICLKNTVCLPRARNPSDLAGRVGSLGLCGLCSFFHVEWGGGEYLALSTCGGASQGWSSGARLTVQ